MMYHLYLENNYQKKEVEDIITTDIVVEEELTGENNRIGCSERRTKEYKRESSFINNDYVSSDM